MAYWQIIFTCEIENKPIAKSSIIFTLISKNVHWICAIHTRESGICETRYLGVCEWKWVERLHQGLRIATTLRRVYCAGECWFCLLTQSPQCLMRTLCLLQVWAFLINLFWAYFSETSCWSSAPKYITSFLRALPLMYRQSCIPSPGFCALIGQIVFELSWN